jgi:hypothetical protein
MVVKPKNGGGKKLGVKNYKNHLLVDAVGLILPTGRNGWTRVASKYQEFSREAILRDADKVKRHFNKNIAMDGVIPPTGTTEKSKLTILAQKV